MIDWAGVAVARACQAVEEQRAYPVALLFGGGRLMHDLARLVGGKSAATINYSTVEEIRAADPPIEDSIHQPTDPAILATLSERLDDFRRASPLDGLTPEKFGGSGRSSTSGTTSSPAGTASSRR